jgi:hypothetical protein
MRNAILIALVSVSSLGAQQTAVPPRTVVSHPYDPATDITVDLLGEDSGRNTLNGLRLRDATAPACVINPSLFVSSSRLPLGAMEIGKGSVAVPSGWTARAFAPASDQPALDQPTADHATAQWSRLATIAAQPTNGGVRGAQVFIFYGSDEGFPNVRLLKDSKVVTVNECTATLNSSQPVSIIRASVVTPGRGALIYVIGYAKVNDALWVSFLGSSPKSSDEGVLTEMVKSLAVSSVK